MKKFLILGGLILVFIIVISTQASAQIPAYKSWLANGLNLYTLSPFVGIGSANPTFPLDIVGDVRWTGTLQGGSVPWARLTNFPSPCAPGQFVTSVGGTLTCGTPTGGIGGSGTDNYLSRWNGSSSLETSVIYQDDTP